MTTTRPNREGTPICLRSQQCKLTTNSFDFSPQRGVLIGRCFLQLAGSASHLVGQSLQQAPRPPPFMFEPSLNGIEPFVHADFNAIEQLFDPLDVKLACFSSTKRSGRVGVGLSRSVGCDGSFTYGR